MSTFARLLKYVWTAVLLVVLIPDGRVLGALATLQCANRFVQVLVSVKRVSPAELILTQTSAKVAA